MTTGRCLCGDISFKVNATPQGASVCHCRQCRKQSGHIWASAYVAMADLSISGTVKWYAASATAKRGFCPNCGSFLFWKAHAEDTMSFALGALDDPTGITIEKHIFVADKGDYYDIADGVPQKD
ncbi:Glutathione-dependent formaldehyde-activating enzyme [Roseovarius gaetbuli]|uniref:Glutathione-dependent formaldehyde-activating enzyme n=1 Tax=Roseovarius gaetbuli TaxID=1356575 RepID=A0A1X6ZHP1_9RHOB|nr:GFA family protein [Roseovarius gaetbuli]SLN51755.1 Glutathione-dependent formaldehyde-activating enzyme [Roseovarius gaetbuli]